MPQPRLANRCLYPVKVKQNFDWSETNKKLVIFSLNFKRSNLIETVIKNFNTSISCTDWIHIIGNDGVEEDFQHLYKHNVRFFTIFRDNTVERNGSFLRNYFIKRCQSKLLLQKDAEVVLLDDPVKNCIEFGKPWRPGWVYPLSESHTKFYLLNGSLDVKGKLQPSGTTPQYNMHGYPNKIVDFGKYSAEFAKNNIIKAAGGFCISCYFHYAYCIETAVLESMRGYDERFTSYGFEDSDMFCRLAAIGQHITPDYKSRAIHLFHTKFYTPTGLRKMQQIFLNSDPNNSTRNLYQWGEGK